MKISRYIFTGIGFVIVFVTVRLVLWIIQKILESVFELPILKTFNKAGGMFAAGLLYIVELSVILFVIKCFSTLNFMAGIVNAIDSTIITKFMYNYNIVTWLIISKIF